MDNWSFSVDKESRWWKEQANSKEIESIQRIIILQRDGGTLKIATYKTHVSLGIHIIYQKEPNKSGELSGGTHTFGGSDTRGGDT